MPRHSARSSAHPRIAPRIVTNRHRGSASGMCVTQVPREEMAHGGLIQKHPVAMKSTACGVTVIKQSNVGIVCNLIKNDLTDVWLCPDPRLAPGWFSSYCYLALQGDILVWLFVCSPIYHFICFFISRAIALNNLCLFVYLFVCILLKHLAMPWPRLV